MRRLSVLAAALLVLAACSSDDPVGRDAAQAACRSVRQSIEGERLDPERTYRFLDRALRQAEQASDDNARYQPLAKAIEDFRRTLRAPATYTDSVRFALAARAAKQQCQGQVDVDIGVAG